MNKLALHCIILVLGFNIAFLSADVETRLELRAGAFIPNSSLYENIYGKLSPNFQLQSTIKCSDCFEYWTNFDWVVKHGHSIGFNDPTTVNIVNYSLGVNFLYDFGYRSTFYLGIGPSIGRIWVKNKSACLKEKIAKTFVAGVLKTGVYHDLSDYIFIDLFLDYLYQPVHFQKYVDIGGFRVGFGLGVKF